MTLLITFGIFLLIVAAVVLCIGGLIALAGLVEYLEDKYGWDTDNQAIAMIILVLSCILFYGIYCIVDKHRNPPVASPTTQMTERAK